METISRLRQKMDGFLLLFPQLTCCIMLLLIKSVPVTHTSPSLSTDDTHFGNARTTGNEQSRLHQTNMHISETANFHIQPTSVKQITATQVTNLIATSTESTIISKSEEKNQHQQHQHTIHSLMGSEEYQLHQSSTAFIIQPTSTQVQPTQTKSTYFSDTNSIITSIPTFTKVISVFSSDQTSSDTIRREMTSAFPKDFKTITTATNIERTSIFQGVQPKTDPPKSSTQQPTPPNATFSMTTTFNNLTHQTTQRRTILRNVNSTLQTTSSTTKRINLETTSKKMLNQFGNTTEQSIEVFTQAVLNKSSHNQATKTLPTEAMMVNRTTSQFSIRPTPSATNRVTRPAKTKFKPSHLSSSSKESTQRPTRNIISLDERIQSRLRSSKSSTSLRSGLLHLTEDDPPSSHAYKPVMTKKKTQMTISRNSNGRFLAAVTTEFMKSSEMIPDLFVAPTKTQKNHPTRSSYEGQGGGGGGGGGALTAITSVTAALSFRSKDEPMILSATATLNPSRMTYTCTIPCSQPDCTCCQDKQLAPATATKAVTGQPPSNATPNIEVSTNKSLSEQISLSAKFGIGMGCLIAIWLVVGPVICLICRIRDKVKESEENVDELGERKKKKKPQPKENSTSLLKEHPLTEAIVMDELNKQFSKKKNTRENEYLLLAKDKAELECLSRSDISKAINNKPMSTFDRTRSPHCLNRWDESDIEDDSEDEEKNRLSPLSNTPTVSV